MQQEIADNNENEIKTCGCLRILTCLFAGPCLTTLTHSLHTNEVYKIHCQNQNQFFNN